MAQQAMLLLAERTGLYQNHVCRGGGCISWEPGSLSRVYCAFCTPENTLKFNSLEFNFQNNTPISSTGGMCCLK